MLKFFFTRRLNRFDGAAIAVEMALLMRGHWIVWLLVVLVLSVASVTGEMALARGEPS